LDDVDVGVAVAAGPGYGLAVVGMEVALGVEAVGELVFWGVVEPGEVEVGEVEGTAAGELANAGPGYTLVEVCVDSGVNWADTCAEGVPVCGEAVKLLVVWDANWVGALVKVPVVVGEAVCDKLFPQAARKIMKIMISG
jgi:hypothetical protein